MSTPTQKRLLILEIMEPLEACQQFDWGEYGSSAYESLVEFSLEQMKGLQDFHLRFLYSDEKALDAIRFWILPLMGDQYEMSQTGLYSLKDWGGEPVSIEFTSQPQTPAFPIKEEGFDFICQGSLLCPMLSARVIHTALAKQSHDYITGKSPHEGLYFEALKKPYTKQNHYELPAFERIESAADFQKALSQPFGPRLKKILKRHQSPAPLEPKIPERME